MQSFIDTDKLISIHSSRLQPFFHDQKYHISPLETAATDNQEYAIDYISAHRGDPSDVHSFEFLIHWLGYDISEATWQPYSTIADTAALDSYLLSHIEQHPDLILFIPKADLKLISSALADNALYYVFEYLNTTFWIPAASIDILKDRAALRRAAKALPTFQH